MSVKDIYWLYEVLLSRIYLFLHPHLWGKHIGINGLPRIDGIRYLDLGDNVYINNKVYIQCSEKGSVKIGHCVTLSYDCVILTSGVETINYPRNCMVRGRKHSFGRVLIGDGVWLGARSVVLPGVTIADKIVVGAGSVVTKNLDKEGWLYAGVPAKPIKAL